MAKSADAFRTISEVAEWLDTPAHVLRFWESKFSQVKPVKRAGGRRYYRPQDMLLLGGIKKLLHDDGMTIKGVQKLLREQGVKHVASLSPKDTDDDGPMPAPQRPSETAPEAGQVVDFPGGAETEASGGTEERPAATIPKFLSGGGMGASRPPEEESAPQDAAETPEEVASAEPEPEPEPEPEHQPETEPEAEEAWSPAQDSARNENQQEAQGESWPVDEGAPVETAEDASGEAVPPKPEAEAPAPPPFASAPETENATASEEISEDISEAPPEAEVEPASAPALTLPEGLADDPGDDMAAAPGPLAALAALPRPLRRRQAKVLRPFLERLQAQLDKSA
ncbi:MAG: MerR family transcriptional regulator [Roseovarius sp.]